DATLQCDGWTGENHHHLLGFMMTARRKLHTIKVHDASMDPHTAEELLKQILDAISRIETKWGASVIACTTDTSGESQKARCLLQEQLPHIVVPNCLAHQVKDDYGVYGDMAQELITWLRSKTRVLAILCEIQMATIGKTLAVLRAVLTRWMSHYLAYCHLLELHPALELLVTKHEAHLISGGDAWSIATIKNATFWHALAQYGAKNKCKNHARCRWKALLEPISLMTNVHQAAQARPENVAISFGFLHFHYSKIDNDTDLAAHTAVLASIKRCWEQCNLEVFIAAIIMNPFYKVSPFQNVPLTTRAGLATLFACLWHHFYNTNDVPLNLYMDLDDYLNSSHDFTYMDNYKLSLLYRAEKEGVSVDPIDIWTGLSHPGSARQPLHTIAQCLLSICPNSASCECLFSMFGAILTKWRNWLSTETLTLLAELKMYVHEEH
ncbi:ribonuclease H-like domain-containing protein, partial [Suillus spraguei]